METRSGQVWTTGGSVAWFGQYETSSDGQDAASSPPMGLNSTAEISTTLMGPGTLGFRWRVSSRTGGHFLTFLLDGVACPGAIFRNHHDLMGAGEPRDSRRRACRNLALFEEQSAAAGEDRGWVGQLTYSGFPAAAPGYAAWNELRFTAAERAIPAISGPDADPDHDGMANILEAVLGTGPRSPDSADQALKLVGTSREGGTRTISLLSKIAADGISNVTLRLAMRPDFATGIWTTLAVKTGDEDWSSQPTTETTESTTNALRVPVVFEETIPSAGSERRFYRLSAAFTP